MIIYTDGACLGNPGPGGLAYVLLWKGKRKEYAAGYRLTTNNRMEILAAIEALSFLNKQKKWNVELHSDSRLLSDAINKGWLKSWAAKGWRKSDRSPVLNVDLWSRLLPLLEEHNVKFVWVQGHAGVPENERCDQLASEAALNPENVDREYEMRPKENGEPESNAGTMITKSGDKIIIQNSSNKEKLTLNYADVRDFIRRLQDFLNQTHS